MRNAILYHILPLRFSLVYIQMMNKLLLQNDIMMSTWFLDCGYSSLTKCRRTFRLVLFLLLQLLFIFSVLRAYIWREWKWTRNAFHKVDSCFGNKLYQICWQYNCLRGYLWNNLTWCLGCRPKYHIYMYIYIWLYKIYENTLLWTCMIWYECVITPDKHQFQKGYTCTPTHNRSRWRVSFHIIN